MGFFRCISKPFKRAAFKYSKEITNDGIQNVYQKYSKKYILKFQKHSIPVEDIQPYQSELLHKLNVEKGLAHGKTREYWLLRGPRLFCTILIGVISNTCCTLFLQENPEVWATISSGLIWLLLSGYMLYQRLPDSIHSSLMRIGHDHYTDWKINVFSTFHMEC